MGDVPGAALGIIGALFGAVAQWVVGRGTKESDELRGIYAAWAAAAHHLVTTVESVRDDAQASAFLDGWPTEVEIENISSDPARWKATGIEKAFLALEKARFTVVMSDGNERRVTAIVSQTERLSKNLRISMTLDQIDAEKKALEEVVVTHLRDAFRLRSIFDV